MVQSLEQYIAQSTGVFEPAKENVRKQMSNLLGELDTANKTINRNYAVQQSQLENQRNQAAESASLQAAGSGGSFGGAANIANRKYYEQSFVPAQTQLQTNQANELAAARRNYETQKTNLDAQLSQLDAQARQQALQQYWSAQEAEAQRQAQLRAQREANNAQRYLMDAYRNQGTGYNLSSTRNLYGGYDWTDSQGNLHRAATVAASAGGDFNNSLFNVLQMAANQGDAYSNAVMKQLQGGARFEKNNTGKSTGNAMYDTLGIRRVR